MAWWRLKLAQSKADADVAVGSFATEPAGPACHLMSASLRKRPKRLPVRRPLVARGRPSHPEGKSLRTTKAQCLLCIQVGGLCGPSSSHRLRRIRDALVLIRLHARDRLLAPA